jgi:hypothetical protein
MTDVRGSLADQLQELATKAREDGHYREAQRLEFQARWLRTRPTDIGGDKPPEVLLSAEERHVRFAGSVWEEFGSFLEEQNGANGHKGVKHESLLPYTKEDITAAVQLLLDIGEGRTQCSYIDTRAIPTEALEKMRGALARLEEFVPDSEESEV